MKTRKLFLLSVLLLKIVVFSSRYGYGLFDAPKE